MNILEQAAKVLAEIEEQIAICEAAPKGPWDKSRYHFPDRSVVQRTDGEDNDAYPGLRMICGDIQHPNVAAFIASSRTVCPLSLRCLKTAIEGLLEIYKYDSGNGCCDYGCDTPTIAENLLITIITEWNENK